MYPFPNPKTFKIMSFFDDASLAFLPSGAAGKDGKAYSIKPTDGTGDFTFSRGSNLAATRVGADGLIEKGRENLLLQSNQFDTTWTLSGASVTSGQSGYDGSSDAWLLSKSAANGRVFQDIGSSGVQTFSVYAKAAVNDWAFLLVNGGGNPSAWFDLSTGSLGSAVGGVISHNISDVGNGWYKISISFNETITRVRIYVGDADNDNSSASGNIYIQDAQLEIGLAATDVIESGATTGKAGLLEDEPRFDYSGGATCPSLLLEPSRTNLIPYSEYLGYSTYSPVFGGVIEYDSTIQTPQGTNGCYTFYDSDGSTYARIRHAAGGFTLNDKITASVFVKGTPNSQMFLGGEYADESCVFNLQTKTLVTQQTNAESYKIEDYGNGWTRYSVVSVFGNAQGNGFEYSQIRVSGDSSNKVPLWGWQLESDASYPTSYIPNHSGGSVTRGADLGTAGDYIGSTITFGPTDDFSIFYDGEIFKKDLMILGGGDSGLNAGRVWIRNTQIRIDGTTPSVSLMADTNVVVDLNTRFKLLVKRNGATIDFFLDGSKLTTTQGDTDATFVINSLLWSFSNAYTAFGKHNQLLVFDSALSDADCITLTTL